GAAAGLPVWPRPGTRLPPLLSWPLPIRSAGGAAGRASSPRPAAISCCSPCTTFSSRSCAGRRSSMSSPNSTAAATIPAVGRIPLPALAVSSLVLVTTALAFVFYVAPNDQTLGFSQRIFYFHVSIAFTAYACFICGAWQALRHLWKRDPSADLASYVCVHLGLIFGTLVLITGSIWAKIAWGRLWIWSEDELVLFLVLYLFYCAYFMLRFSVDPGPQRANLS